MSDAYTADRSGPLAGKVAIVTGATSGLGFAITQALLRLGATVYLAARNEGKAHEAIARLETEGLAPGHGRPVFHKLVLDDPRDAKASAEEFLKREERLDLLINNASLMIKSYAMGPIGVQDMLTVNHLSPFIFTHTLLPLLLRTASLPCEQTDVRIVTVASNAHTYATRTHLPRGFLSKDDLNGPSPGDDAFSARARRYGLSKLANVLYTRVLGRKLPGLASQDGTQSQSQSQPQSRGVLAMCVHPGAVFTEGNARAAADLPWPFSVLAALLMRVAFRTPEQGAQGVVDAVTAPLFRAEFDKYQGAYLEPEGWWEARKGKGKAPGVKLGKASELGRDERLAEELWALSERILREEGIEV